MGASSGGEICSSPNTAPEAENAGKEVRGGVVGPPQATCQKEGHKDARSNFEGSQENQRSMVSVNNQVEWVKGVVKTEVFAISKFSIQKHTLDNDTFADGILKKVGLSFDNEEGKAVWKLAKRDFNTALRQKRCTCVTAMQTKAIGKCDSAGALS